MGTMQINRPIHIEHDANHITISVMLIMLCCFVVIDTVESIIDMRCNRSHIIKEHYEHSIWCRCLNH